MYDRDWLERDAVRRFGERNVGRRRFGCNPASKGRSARPSFKGYRQKQRKLTLMLEEDVVPDQRLVYALEVFVADSSDRVRSFGAL